MYMFRWLIVCVVMSVVAAGCSKNKGNSMTLHAAGGDIATYKAAFGEYVDVQTVDASQSGYSYTETPSRYVVYVMKPGVSGEPVAPDRDKLNGFFITISDNGENVDIQLAYVVGAREENPTVVSPAFLKGKAVITNKFTFRPNTKDPTGRAAAVAHVVHGELAKLEETKK